jgi:hypothetical protein
LAGFEHFRPGSTAIASDAMKERGLRSS